MMIDEADIDNLGSTSTGAQGRGVKRPQIPTDSISSRPGRQARKPGPLSKDFVYKRRAIETTHEEGDLILPYIDFPQYFEKGKTMS